MNCTDKERRRPVDRQGRRGDKALLDPVRHSLICGARIEPFRLAADLRRVLPNYQGNWLGSYVIQNCTETQDFQNPDFCAAIFPIGRVFPAVFLFTQSGTTVSGRAILGQISSDTIAAPIQDDGSMQFPATATVSPSTFSETWSVNQTQAGTITGTLHVLVTNAILLGTATMDANVIVQPATVTASTGSLQNPTHPQSLAALAAMLQSPRE